VVPVRKLLRIVAGPGTLVDEGGRTASLLVSASGSAPLRVRETDADTGAPIAGDAILFSVPASARSTLGSDGGKSARATTNASVPPGVRDAFAGIRALDQFLSGRLGLPAWLQSVIDALLGQFLPGWFYAVVRLGDDLGTLLSFVRAEGRMRLSPGADTVHLAG